MTFVAPMHTITDIHQQLMLTAVVLLLIMTAVVIIGFRLSNVAHGQVTPETITPQQKAIMCDPNDRFVNSTESAVCGLPQSIKTNETTNATTPVTP